MKETKSGIRMTNDENVAARPGLVIRASSFFRHSSFVIRISFVIRHSSFPPSFCRRHPWQGFILRMRPNLSRMFGPTPEIQLRLALVVGRRCGSYSKVILAIRQGKVKAEGPIGTQLDGPPSHCNLRVRFRRAVDNEFGIDVEPKPLGLRLLVSRWT